MPVTVPRISGASALDVIHVVLALMVGRHLEFAELGEAARQLFLQLVPFRALRAAGAASVDVLTLAREVA